jgi:hypothetical protein
MYVCMYVCMYRGQYIRMVDEAVILSEHVYERLHILLKKRLYMRRTRVSAQIYSTRSQMCAVCEHVVLTNICICAEQLLDTRQCTDMLHMYTNVFKNTSVNILYLTNVCIRAEQLVDPRQCTKILHIFTNVFKNRSVNMLC